MIRAEYRFCLGIYTEPLYKAILAEEKQPAPEKGQVSLRLEEGCLVLDVKARDLSGLRALSNSFLLLIHAAYSSMTNTEEGRL